MQPTREQVVKWAENAGFEVGCINSIDGDEVFNPRTRDKHAFTDELVKLVHIAYAAGRAQGLKEAVDSCINVAHKQSTLGRAFAASDCVRSIEQLKGKQ